MTNEGGTSAILLAAGLSSRMGKLKALLPWQGLPLIQYQIEQMQDAGISEIIVVLGSQSDQLQKFIMDYDVKAVLNERYKQGKSSSIRKGAACIKNDSESILVSTVDQPVPANTLMKLQQYLKVTQAPAVIPVYQGKRGHPILFHSSLKDDLLVVTEKTKGLRNVIQKYNKQITYLTVNDPSILLNFNKPEDYMKEAYNESFRD